MGVKHILKNKIYLLYSEMCLEWRVLHRSLKHQTEKPTAPLKSTWKRAESDFETPAKGSGGACGVTIIFSERACFLCAVAGVHRCAALPNKASESDTQDGQRFRVQLHRAPQRKMAIYL